MRTRFPLATVATMTVVAVFSFGWLTNSVRSQDSAVPPAPVPADPTMTGPPLSPMADGDENLAGAEVLTRGPVHEAFASPTLLDPEATPKIAKKPPEPIEEIPPDERPDGDNVIWIPGYWAWDDERNDYLWVSGLYRNSPPNQTWVPGTWNEVAGGFQWSPGFWTSAKQAEVTYLEQAPPANLEAGPSSPAPSDNHFWIPGCWTYQDVRYVWRPGYWGVSQPNWVWVPARYTWCPGGYVYLPGYWDYLPDARGCLFAPVYFTQPIYYQPAFVYRPAVVINTGFFSANLFCRPAFCHYYFGDYFAVRYSNVGFRPWFSVAVGVGGRPCYDPFFTYYNCHNRRHDRDWLVRAERRYDHLRRDEHARPAHTFASYKKEKVRSDRSGRDEVLVAKSIKEVKRDGDIVKLREVDRIDREKYVKQATETKKVAKERREIEKQTDLARSRENADRRRDDGGKTDPKAVVKVSDKKLKLPTVAKVDSPARDRGDKVNRAVDTAKRNDDQDRSQRTTGPRLVDSDKKADRDADLKKKGTDRGQANVNRQVPGIGQAGVDTRRSDQAARKSAADLAKQQNSSDVAKKAVDRARNSAGATDRRATSGPALSQSDAARRRTTNDDATQRRVIVNDNNQQRNSVSQPSRRTTTPSGGSDSGRATRSSQSQPQPQLQIPRSSSSQPRIQSGGGSSSGGRSSSGSSSGGSSSGSRNQNQDNKDSKRRSGRSADAGSPRSNVDIAPTSPNLSSVARSVDEQFNAERSAKDVVKDDLQKLARDEARGAPRESRTPATSDQRGPSILGPTGPDGRGVAQTDSGGPALGPADGNRTPGDHRQTQSRSGFASNENEATPGRDSGRSAATSRQSADGATPGRAPLSRYDSMMQQGQSLSRVNVRERPGTVDEDGNIDPRKAKNPIGSVGFGSSPKRYGTPRADGPLGFGQPPGIGNSAASEKPRGSGSYMDPSTSQSRWGSQQQSSKTQHNSQSPSRNSTGRPYDPTRGR